MLLRMFLPNLSEGRKETSILESTSLMNAEKQSYRTGSMLVDANPVERLSLLQEHTPQKSFGVPVKPRHSEELSPDRSYPEVGS